MTKRRCGVVMNLCLDYDIPDLIRSMAPSGKRYSAFISELVRQEALRRQVRQETLDELRAQGLLMGEMCGAAPVSAP
jgi:hypothetical protein